MGSLAGAKMILDSRNEWRTSGGGKTDAVQMLQKGNQGEMPRLRRRQCRGLFGLQIDLGGGYAAYERCNFGSGMQ